eukprot:CAMPEP_0198225190 /NCGR_PEP_ID=MMETSP1445-20131203/100089_1 /TAXON_ID=36898 /ORGANISM="Pyramimonas sp., Strain CCMP2087" /LENGTH=61 /DNA_ID=CAMNT_0043904623 /DNA_START=87 /DNA_END=272 /DNA_ORIENTATION=+
MLAWKRCGRTSSSEGTVSLGEASSTSAGIQCNVSSSTCWRLVAVRSDVSTARRHLAPPGAA